MLEKIKVQICFANNANLEKVKEQLEILKKEDKYKFYCCFLPRHIVEEKGFSTDIDDALESILGDDLVWSLKNCKNFEEAMSCMKDARANTVNAVEKVFVLDSGVASGVAEEISLFTNNKVILME